jgi:hypothetical protein
MTSLTPQGLPPASKNQHAWPLKKPLLAAAAAYKPGPAAITASAAFFRAMLRVRYSTPLLRLPAAAAVRGQVSFENTGPGQVPGVIIMRVASAAESARSGGSAAAAAAAAATDGGVFDPELTDVVVVFNARPEEFRCRYPRGCRSLELHPALAELAESDPAVGGCHADDVREEITVAPRAAAVYVARRRLA